MSPEDMNRSSFGTPRNGGYNKFQQQKNGNYSPSTSFNYNTSNNNNNNRPASGFNNQNQSQHPRRRTDRYKRETINYSERIVHQNDLMIKLLKEIRDLVAHGSGQAVKTYAEPAEQAIQMDNDDQIENDDEHSADDGKRGAGPAPDGASDE